MDDEDYGIYDSRTGKVYSTLFDLEQDYYDSIIFNSSSLPDPPVIEPLKIEPLQMAYTPTEMDMDSLTKSITPIFTQRLDGVYVVGYNCVPNIQVVYSISIDDLF